MLTLAFIATFLSFIGPEWAAVANTALLIVLTLLSGSNRQKLTRNTVKLENIHQDVSNAASAAQSAAAAAASAATASSDAARISKELGGNVRHSETE